MVSTPTQKDRATILQAIDSIRHFARNTDQFYWLTVTAPGDGDAHPVAIRTLIDNPESEQHVMELIDGQTEKVTYREGWFIGLERGDDGRLVLVHYSEKLVGRNPHKRNATIGFPDLDTLLKLVTPERFVEACIQQVLTARQKAQHRVDTLTKKHIFLMRLRDRGPTRDYLERVSHG